MPPQDLFQIMMVRVKSLTELALAIPRHASNKFIYSIYPIATGISNKPHLTPSFRQDPSWPKNSSPCPDLGQGGQSGGFSGCWQLKRLSGSQTARFEFICGLRGKGYIRIDEWLPLCGSRRSVQGGGRDTRRFGSGSNEVANVRILIVWHRRISIRNEEAHEPSVLGTLSKAM